MGLEIRFEITSLEWNGLGGVIWSGRSCLKKAEILMAASNVIK